MATRTNEIKLRRELVRVEKQLVKDRAATVFTHGWGAMRYAKTQRSWDVLAQRKMAIKEQLEACESAAEMCRGCDCWKQTRANCS